MSSRRSPAQRRIDELLGRLKEGDRLIVSELSRLARSVGQIAVIVDQLLKNKICFISFIDSAIELVGVNFKCVGSPAPRVGVHD
jgi:DNA invertase Pin-like site-specific DNA recombinase